MNAQAPPAGVTRQLRNGVARVAVALALAASAVALASCSGSPTGSTASDHSCADTVVKAVTSGKSVPGTWACLAPALQTTFKTYGHSGDAIFADPNMVNANLRVTYLGAHGGVVAYEVDFPASSTQTAHTDVLVVYVDSSGLVTNLGVGSPLY